MAENGLIPVYEEKFRNIEKEIVDLKTQTSSLKTKTDENENGRLITQVQLMFNNAAQNTATENARRDAEKMRSDEKQEKAAEKQNLLITQIGENVNKSIYKTEALEIKVDKIQLEQTALSKRVEDSEDKTKIDTSLFIKWIVGIAGTAVVIAVVTFILKFVFKLF